jgi:hypothetical protein
MAKRRKNASLLLREAPLETLQQFGFYDDKGNPVQEVISSLKTIPQGAATTIWCATSPLINNIGGVYCEDADIAGLASGEGLSAGVTGCSPARDGFRRRRAGGAHSRLALE